MRNKILFTITSLGTLLVLAQCNLSEEAQAASLHKQYCGTCHVAPDPGFLTKDLWAKQVLPEMGARLGIQVGDYNPMKGLNMEEAFHIEQARIYPQEPLIAQADWDQIYNYVLRLAPDSLPVDPSRMGRSQGLTQFQAREIAIDKLPGALITAIQYDSLQHQWNIGNRTGEWYTLQRPDSSKLEYLFASALSGFDQSGKTGKVVVEMGYMHPSDLPKGRLWQFGEGSRSVLTDNLYRPVFVKSLDIDGDDQLEYVLCEFGNRAGRLSLLQQEGQTFKKKSLLNLPGTIKVESADMNKDGRMDLVVLAGQGDEGIYILYNQGNGDFSVKHPIRLPPIYGSSWFELFDYEGDGDLDVALVNGDNADFTYALKPYHGFRLFLNNGDDTFAEGLFYPIYGATRVIARDFDQDGDVDFAISALFPDFKDNPLESFVYLENQDAANFRFQSYTTPLALEGHWLIMEAGDFEADGDLDILLGSYVDSPSPVPDSLRKKWHTQNVDLLLLENKTVGDF